MKRLFREHAVAGVAVLSIGLAVLARILPHPANFAPVAAVAILGGAVLPRRLAIITPVLAMVVSDVIIGMYDWRIMCTVWVCYGVTAYASSRVLKKPTVVRGMALTLAASCFFFVVTNFAVWAASGMYAHTWQGLASCYYFALPFFRNTILGDTFYVMILFFVFVVAADCVHHGREVLARRA